jgi:uncharacterized membrane protein YccC
MRHAARVSAAAAVAFAIEVLLDLPQGYWAVFTAILVVQTSIGGALAASRDRLIGTLAGAVVGGAAANLSPHTPLGLGVALVVAVAVLALGAAKYPSLKIGPVTAAILIVTTAQHGDPLYSAALRVAEIMLGSLVGVGATLVVFPARARDAARARAGAVLGQLQVLFGHYGDALAANSTPQDVADLHAGLRAGLVALEGVVAEAAREARAHLSSGEAPDALPRTLWRVRNDAVMIGRSLSHSFPAAIAALIAAPACALTEAVREDLKLCAAALAQGRRVERSPLPAAVADFHNAFQGLRGTGLMRELSFDDVGHVFGLAWALEGLARNLSDLADRIDELASQDKAGVGAG